MTDMNLGIVCGYGVSLENDLERYADSISEFLDAGEVDSLILCGGYTVEQLDYSEAGLMQRLLQERGVKQQLFLEQKSVTSLHNLLFARKIIEGCNEPIQSVYIFCDSARKFKIYCLSKIIFSDFVVTVVSFRRKEFILIYLIQLPSTLIQSLGVIFPELGDALFASRNNLNRIMDRILRRSPR